jgi:Ca-activated chloride channel family protein
METVGDYVAAAITYSVIILVAFTSIIILGRYFKAPEQVSNPVGRVVAQTTHNLGGRLEQLVAWLYHALLGAGRNLVAAYGLVQESAAKLLKLPIRFTGWLLAPWKRLAAMLKSTFELAEESVDEALDSARKLADQLLAPLRWVNRGVAAILQLAGEGGAKLVASGQGLVRRLLAPARWIARGLVAMLILAQALGMKLAGYAQIAGYWLLALLRWTGRGVAAILRLAGAALAKLAGYAQIAGYWLLAPLRWTGRGVAAILRLAGAALAKLAGYAQIAGYWLLAPLRWTGRGVATLYRVGQAAVAKLIEYTQAGVGWLLARLLALGRLGERAGGALIGAFLMVTGRLVTGVLLALEFPLRGVLAVADKVSRTLGPPLVKVKRLYMAARPALGIAYVTTVAIAWLAGVLLFKPLTTVTIEFWTNDTKAEWVGEVTDLFNEAEIKTGSGKRIIVEVEQLSSGDMFPGILAGEIKPTVWSPGESSWINDANLVWEGEYGRPLTSGDCPEVVFTAIGIGMYRPMAEAMGWPDVGIGWDDIIALASDPQGWGRYGHPEWGLFKFGHTHPDSSNTGFLAMATLAYSAAGVTEGLTPEMVRSDEVVEAFRRIELNTHRYGMSTKGLSINMAERGPSYLHAMGSSEISVMATDFYQKDLLRFPLVFIFPKDGTFWSNNPVCILDADWVNDNDRQAAEIYRDFLLSPAAQRLAADEWLRPANLDMPRQRPPEWDQTDISVSRNEVPAVASVSGETKAALIDVFYQAKKPATVMILLDSSNSMSGSKLRKAVEGTAGFFNLLRGNDGISAYHFDTTVEALGPDSRVGDLGGRFEEFFDGLRARGKTSLYDAVCTAVEQMETIRTDDKEAGRKRLYGIVLLSDGEDTASKRSERQMFRCLPSGEDVEGIKIFTIAYGKDADEAVLARIAEETNGRFYTSDPDNIEEIYLQISFEQ